MRRYGYIPRCRKCGREFKDRRGLMGHYRFKHRIELDTGEPVRETKYMRTITDNIERIRQLRREKKEFEAWRRRKIRDEREVDYETWLYLKERGRI